MATIKKIWAREILDSRGIPTVEVACGLDSGHVAVSSVPSGISTGSYEAIEIRDNDPKRYGGKGVLKVVNNINNIISNSLIGKDPSNQEEIDSLLCKLDGTENKSNLGANATLAVSEVACKLGAIVNGKSLYSWINDLALRKSIKADIHIPTPIFNMINGGLHGSGNLDFQEFHVIPTSIKNFSEGLKIAVEIYMSIGKNLSRRGAIHSIGDEGGYAPNLFTNIEAFSVIVESIKEIDYKLGRDVFLGLDVAASVFYKDDMYYIKDKTTPLDEFQIIEYYKELNNQFHLSILEDALYEDAWGGWKKLTEYFNGQLTIIGDDFLVTNVKRIKKAISEKACNGILIKPNQVGTVSETLDVIKAAKDAGWKIIVSHRSGETNDWFIADFAVGLGSDYVKFGAPARGERVAKYNRLSSIEIELTQR